MRLYLRTLGGLSLDPGTVTISRGRLAILACVAAAGRRGLTRDRLVALFWPESDTDRARGALKQATFQVRRESGAADLLLGTSELRLNPEAIGADIWDFEHAIANGEWERAVGLYAGPFLDGVHLNGNPEFERWADQERERLARACRRALECLARSAEEAGDQAGAVRWWRQLSAADPLSSTVAVALMRALVAAGDSAAALRHARVHEALVQEELGASADIAVRELERAIREAPTGLPASIALPASLGDHETLPEETGSALLATGEDGNEARPGNRVRPWVAVAAVLVVALAFGTRLAPALSTRFDGRFSSWSHLAALPGNRESVRELGLGIDAFRRAPAPGPELSEAIAHFQASARLDSTSATPLVWAAFAHAWWDRGSQAESVLAQLRDASREFGPWDRAMMDVTQAWVAGNLAAAHAASHRLVALAPKSEWRLLLAWDAWSVGRAQEAIDVLQDMEPDPDWISGRSRYWAVLGAAYHLAGVFEAELEAARKALATEPDSRSLIQLEVRALAALGRDQEVEARCERALTLTADHASDYQPCGQGIAELWAHGKPGPARQLADRLVAQYAIAPDGALDIAGTLLDVRDIHGAERALGDHRPEELEDPAYLEIVTLLAAARGDRAGARIGLERLDALAQAGLGETRLNRRSFRRAEVAALLGDREAAVAWLTRAFREGLRIRTALHWDFAFDGLADYPPYQALLKPVEGSDAVATTPP